MTDIDNSWLELMDSAVDRLHAKDSNWKSLTLRDQELAALWKLEADMNNGGFVQFFCNWGIECYYISVKALKNICANKMLEIIELEFSIVNTAYKRSEDKIEAYWDIPKYITEKEIAELDRLDAAFWEYPDDISELGFNHYST